MEVMFDFIVLQHGQLWITLALILVALPLLAIIAHERWARNTDSLWTWPTACWVGGLLLGDFEIGPAIVGNNLTIVQDHNPMVYFHANAVWGLIFAVIGLAIGLYVGFRRTKKYARA